MMALKHSTVLFTREDSAPLSFVLRPCDEKKSLRPLIEHGGGLLSSRGDSKSVKLSTEGSAVSSDEYISTRYVKDCVKANKLLDVAAYRLTKAGRLAMSADDLEEEDLLPAKNIIKTMSRDRKGRKKFALRDDMNIIKFLVEERRCHELKGNVVWRDMETLEITVHTHQSMKDHFRKIILPNIKQYDIPSSWLSALTGVTSDAKRSPFSNGLQRLIKARSPSYLQASSTSTTAAVTRPDSHSLPGDKLRSLPKTASSPKKQSAKSPEVSNVSPRGSPRKKSTPKQSKGGKPLQDITLSGEEDDFDKELYKMAVSVESGCVYDALSECLSDTHGPSGSKSPQHDNDQGQTSKLDQKINSGERLNLSSSNRKKLAATASEVEFSMDTGGETSDTRPELRAGLRKRPYKFKAPKSPVKCPHNDTDTVVSPVRSRSPSPVKTRQGKTFGEKNVQSSDSMVENDPMNEAYSSQTDENSPVKLNYRLRSKTTGGVPELATSSNPNKAKGRKSGTDEETTTSDEEGNKSKSLRVSSNKAYSSQSTDSSDSDEPPLKKCSKGPESNLERRTRLPEHRMRTKRARNNTVTASSISPSKQNGIKAVNPRAGTSKSNGSSGKGNRRSTGRREGKNHSLTNFIMDKDDMASSQECGEGEDSSMEGELSVDLSTLPEDVKKYCMIIKVSICSAVLSGVVPLKTAEQIKLRAPRLIGHPAWTEEDDRVIESANPQEINMLRAKYGSQNVDERAVFLEDSCFK